MGKYLVTGGAGFIGSHIAEALVERGDKVRVLDNLSTGKMENLAGFLRRIEFVEADIRDLDACRRAAEGVDHVLHQAALPSVPRSVEDPLLTNAINITGTLNMMLAARDAGVKSFVQASSSSVYGDDQAPRKVEGIEGKPLSPYAISKLVDERYGRVFYDLYGFPVISLRYFNVFGPRQDPLSQYAAVIPLFITLVLKGEAPTIFGDGEQSRDFTYIDNVVEGNLRAATAGRGGGEVFNIACGERLTVNALFAAVKSILGASLEPVYADPRPGDIKHSTADFSKAQRLLGFEPRVSFLEGLRKTIDWYKTNG
jgi:nucleoside-diphosphate-sugar epimerase